LSKECSRDIILGIEHGLHVRPANAVVLCAKGFESDITIVHDGTTVDAKNPLSLLALASPSGTRLTLKAVGPDSEEAVEALREILETK